MILQILEMKDYKEGSAYYVDNGKIGYKIGESITTEVTE
jgi:hypothetical protein